MDAQHFEIGQSGKTAVLVSVSDCVPCAKMKPVLRKLAAQFPEEFDLVELDGERERDFADAHELTKFPTLMLFENGSVLSKNTGFHGVAELSQSIASFCGVEHGFDTEDDKTFEAAQRLAEAEMAKLVEPARGVLLPHFDNADARETQLLSEIKAALEAGEIMQDEADRREQDARKSVSDYIMPHIRQFQEVQRQGIDAYAALAQGAVDVFVGQKSGAPRRSIICAPDGSSCEIVEG